MKQSEVKVDSGTQVSKFDLIEFNDVLVRFLDNMTSEVYAERYTLEFNDSWDEVVCLSEELDMLLNGEVVYD